MIRKLLTSPFRSLAGVVLSLVLLFGYVYYSNQMPRSAPRPVPQALDAAVTELCREVPEQLPEPERVLKPTLLLPLSGDREGLVTDRLRVALDQQGWYRTVEASLLEKAIGTAQELTGLGSDSSARSMQWTPTELASMIRSAKAESVLRGNVDRLAFPADGPVEIKLRLELWELSSTEPSMAVLKEFVNLQRPEPTAPAPPAAPKASFWSRLRSYGILFLAALIWPFATIPWIRKVLREDSNEANMKALLIITAIPMPIFLLFLLWQGNGFLNIVIKGTIAAMFLFFYTAFVLNAIQNKIR